MTTVLGADVAMSPLYGKYAYDTCSLSLLQNIHFHCIINFFQEGDLLEGKTSPFFGSSVTFRHIKGDT